MSFLFTKPKKNTDTPPANLKPTLINTNAQAQPVTIVYGINKIGATYLCPIWNQKVTPIYAKNGGKK